MRDTRAHRRTFVHAYVRIHADVRACVHAYVRACVRMHVRTYAYTHVRTYVFVRTSMRLTRAAKAAHNYGSKQNKQRFFDKIGIKQILLSAP